MYSSSLDLERSVTSQDSESQEAGLSSSPEEMEVWLQQNAKSVKADNASTPVHVWTTKPMEPLCSDTLVPLREFLLQRWRINVFCSFRLYLRSKYNATWVVDDRGTGSELSQVLEAEQECIWHAMEADWWEWKLGSRPFFWRWPSNQ